MRGQPATEELASSENAEKESDVRVATGVWQGQPAPRNSPSWSQVRTARGGRGAVSLPPPLPLPAASQNKRKGADPR